MPVISLNETTFRTWIRKKKELGYAQKTHSAFAFYLLTQLDAGDGSSSDSSSSSSSESESETESSSSSNQSGTDDEIIVAEVIEREDEQQDDCIVDVTGGLTEPECDDVENKAQFESNPDDSLPVVKDKE